MNSFKVNNRRVYEVSNVTKLEQVVIKVGIVVFTVILNVCLFGLYIG